MITKAEAIQRVIKERNRQNEKWGHPQNNTPFEWLSILTEEVGEFAEALNNALLGGDGNLEHAIHEAVQVAAVAVSIVEHLGKEE
jgi:NTP pyrophosphatase (non-canonical NTP hydrolase)